MQGRDDSYGVLGICQRLFNFIKNNILARGIKRVTLATSDEASPHAHDHPSKTEIFLENGLLRIGNQDQEVQVIRPSVRPMNPEILVEFRHTDEARKEKDRCSKTSDQVLIQENTNLSLTRAKADSKDQDSSNGGGGKGLKKKTTIKESGDRSEKNKKKLTLLEIEAEEKPGHKPHHLLSVASNINEKSDAFIRSRKESMIKNLQPDQNR